MLAKHLLSPILILIAFISFVVRESEHHGAIFTSFSYNLTSVKYLCGLADHRANITMHLDRIILRNYYTVT